MAKDFISYFTSHATRTKVHKNSQILVSLIFVMNFDILLANLFSAT